MRHTVLLVDDEPKVLNAMQRLLRDEPYEILTAGNAEEAADVVRSTPVDLIVCDEEMPGMPGSEFLAKVARDYPDIVRIVLTGHPTLPAALRAINEGRVYQYFTKPCNQIDLAIAMRRALEQKDLMDKSRNLLEATRRQSALIDEARVLRRLRDLSHKDRTKTIAKEGSPADLPELLDEMDQEVAKVQALLESLQNVPQP
ncbi:MAG: response regulator [Phycisphaerae bacterium]|nr:response regulator [Phycisphaerae bacterium]